MKNVIIGTAGHVDHGKTSLIKALTGIDTDRLKEEQERGMSIDIGFAVITLPNGQKASIVDVPGHERFIKNMLAGACGVNAALMVIAADDGVMPQTREHLEILQLLGVKYGVVALTKCDLVEKDWRLVVEADIKQHLVGTFLEKAPIVAVSSTQGFGLNRLKRELMAAASRCPAPPIDAPYRMIIDRAFTKTGFGSIVTGTIDAGTIHERDEIEISPSGIRCRVRTIEIHGDRVKEASAGSRAALNLSGVSLDMVERGEQITPPGLSLTTTRCSVLLRLLPSVETELKDRTRVRMHTGAAEVIGRIKLLFDNSGLSGGHTCFALFTAEVPFAVAYHDTMIMRTYSPQSTIGSALVLDTSPPANPKKLADYRAHLDDRLNGTPEEVLATCLASSPHGIGIHALVGRMRTPIEEVQTGLDRLTALGTATNLGGRYYIHHSSLTALTNRIINTLRDYHENFPARQGMPREDLRAAAANAMETKAFAALLSKLATQSGVVLEGPHVRLSEFEVTLSDRQHQLIESIYQEYERHGIVAPDANEVCKTVGVNRDTLLTLVQVGMLTGRFHRLGEAQFITDSAMNSALALVVERSQTTAGITVGELRDALEANRKAALQVLEYMDAKKMTRRVHERHVIFSHPPI